MYEGGYDSILDEMAALLGARESHEYQDVCRRYAEDDAEVCSRQPHLESTADDSRCDQHYADEEQRRIEVPGKQRRRHLRRHAKGGVEDAHDDKRPDPKTTLPLR